MPVCEQKTAETNAAGSGNRSGQGPRYNVVFSANDAYCQHVTVACLSLLHNNPVCWDVYLITTNFSPQSEEKLRRMVEQKGSRLHLIPMDDSRFKDLPIEYSRFDIHTYFRIYLGKLLPDSVQDVLYLDSDLVVDGNILDLFERPARVPLEAVLDYGMDEERLQLRRNPRYFNAGVLYIPLHHWREEAYHERLLAHVPLTYEYADQEILNDYFKGQWKEIDWKYNTFHFFLYRFKNPRVIHFAGDHKPWLYLTVAGITYWKYLVRTPYRARIFSILKTVRPGIGLFLYYEKHYILMNRALISLGLRRFMFKKGSKPFLNENAKEQEVAGEVM